MKRNGLCPICHLKRMLLPPPKAINIEKAEIYDNNAAPTPPMGWSSWNTFRNIISQEVIYDTAVALKDSGLLEAGYEYINIDDNWTSSMRDSSGALMGDLTRFSDGIPALVKKINDLGIKVGIYSSNGTLTCEDLPASLYSEEKDAKTIASWGIEYFKYDFCHNEPIPKYAPLVYGITLSKLGEREETFYPVTLAKLSGAATLVKNKNVSSGYFVAGLDYNSGLLEFEGIDVEEAGEYVLTIDIVKRGKYKKFLLVEVNNENYVHLYFPPQSPWNHTARFQTKIILNKGSNIIKLYNPIRTRIESAIYQYRIMSKAIKDAATQREKETKVFKPIVFSICEWGFRKPWLWGRTAGNLWRTTPDIRPIWPWIRIIYERNVKLYKYSGKGTYNDPDMLEVGNGKLTTDENMAHFAVWCMMNAPLILGNDLRIITKEILEIVTNKDLIAINQDPLCKQAKRIKKGSVDILAKPLSDNRVAICFLNKGMSNKKVKFNVKSLPKDKYLEDISFSDNFLIYDIVSKETLNLDTINTSLRKHSAKVFIIDYK